MLIGIDASQAAKEKRTGVENFCRELILNLIKSDKTNSYIFYSDQPFTLPEKSKNVKVLVSPMIRFWHNLKLPKMINATKPDVFISPGYMLPIGTNAKMISIIHDFAPKYFSKAYTRKDKILQNLSINRAIAKSKAILFVSKNTLNDFNKFYGGYKGITGVLYQSYDHQTFRREKGDGYRPTKSPYILSVGRLEERKNSKNLIKAYGILRSKYPSIEHKLVLSGKKGFRFNEIKREIGQLGSISKDVILNGFVSSDDMYSMFHNAEVFVFPSLYEGFGIPILEAFSAGVPVACSDSSSLPEVAGDAALYFNPEKPEEIAESLYKILSDSNIRKNLINNSKKRLPLFTWEKSIPQLLKIMQRIVNEK